MQYHQSRIEMVTATTILNLPVSHISLSEDTKRVKSIKNERSAKLTAAYSLYHVHGSFHPH